MSQQVEIRLPRGRLVSGHPMKLRDTTDPITKQKKLNEHGQPKQECFIQIAIPKTEPGLYGADGVFAQLQAVANRPWPENPKNDAFAWKVDDGDSQVQDQKTQQWKQRPDYCLGHWLFNIKAHGWVPTCVYQPAPGQPHQEILDAGMMKTGDYVDAVIRCEPNGAMGQQAGLYMNPGIIRFNEAGGAISTGAGMSASDADSYFAGSNAQAPATPPMGQPAQGQPPMQQAPMGQPAPGQPPMQQAPMGQPAPGQPPMQQAPMGQPAPGQPPAPNYDPNFAAGPGGTVPTA